MKQNKYLVKLIAAVCIMALIVGIMLVVYNHFKPQAVKGSKEITVDVVIPDEKNKEFTIHTDAEYLRQALQEAKLIKGTESEYGLFITEVNGRVADDKKQEWWCITKDSEDVNTGVDATPIMDGDHYEITLKTGF